MRATGKTCLGTKGLIAECDEISHSAGDNRIRDVAIIAAYRRLEYYDTAYLSILAIADRVNAERVVDLLRESLPEEQDADQDLASLQEDLLDDEVSQDEVPDEKMEDEIAQDESFGN